MPVTVVKVTDSKSGKSKRVQVGDQWYGAAADCGLSQGMIIDMEVEILDKFGPWIKKWKAAAGQTVPSPQSAPVDAYNPPRERPASASMAAPYYLAFVSNTVNGAIQAGLIKEPHQISAWAKAAAETAIALEALG